jgi:hypothetical protein
MLGNPYAPASGAAPVSFVAITPSDTDVIGGFLFLRIGGAGNLAVKGVDDGAAVTIAVTAGEYFPFGAGFVMSTNTTATGIVGVR